MSNTQQPDALGYAIDLDSRGFQAEASELRRLHAENEVLKAQRDVLLKALQDCEKVMSERHIEDGYVAIRVGLARAAIASVKGAA